MKMHHRESVKYITTNYEFVILSTLIALSSVMVFLIHEF